MKDVARDLATGNPQTKQLFLEAADLPPAVRALFLDRACGEDAELRGKVERLLDKHDGADRLLDGSPAGMLGLDLTPDGPPTPTSATAFRSAGQSPVLVTRTARYDLVRQIGEGGFGVVWLAVQREPVRRRVAVKLVRPGLIGIGTGPEAMRELLGRFERERQALAVMEHPGIARVYEAGTVEEGPHAGQPFFAMEYVEGPALPSYADAKRLDLPQRVSLLAEVCDAVHHAHTKGVLHRDLKPANVLVGDVTGRPTPKVIDFGIAKLIDDAGATAANLSLTREALFIGTPQYAPPEQAAGRQVDTRGDVYSLGALAYELFVGTPPRDAERLRSVTPSELQRLLCEDEPVHPARRFEQLEPRLRREVAAMRGASSAIIRRALAGELGWIVCRAMAHEPERRYQSAYALAADLRRFLAGEPVEAAPAGKLYLIRKFAGRHRAALATAAMVVAALTVGLSVSTYGLWRARAQATEARRQAAVAEAVNAFFIDDLLAAAVPSSEVGEGRDVTVRQVLDAAGGRLEEAAAPGGRLADQPAVAAAIGRALGNTFLAIGQPRLATDHLRTALGRCESHFGENDDQTIAVVADLARALEEADQRVEAEALNRRALVHLRDTRGGGDSLTLLVAQRLAATLADTDREDEAAEVLEQALADLQAAGGVRSKDSLVASRLVRHHRAMQLASNGDSKGAADLFRAQLNDYRDVLGPDHMTTLASQWRVAEYLMGQKEYAEAVALLQDATIRLRRLAGPAHPDTLRCGYLLAEGHLRCNRPAAARALAENMLATADSAQNADAVTKFQSLLARIPVE